MRNTLSVTAPLVVDDGRNHRLDDLVNPELHPVELRAGAFHGVKQNGVQIDPANPPANVTLAAPPSHFAGPDFKVEIKEPLALAGKILEALRCGGEDAESAYEAMIDTLHAPGGDALDLAGFLAAYDVALGADNFTYSRTLLKKLALAVMGQAWVSARTNEQIFAAAQSFIRGKTRAQLMGDDTEVVEVLS